MTSRPRVLVADDDPEMLDIAATIAEQAGADVVRVDSGATLVQHLAESGPFDLIITDVAMPWISGLQVAHVARTAGHDTPVIVMTALRDRRIAEQVRALGPRAVLLQKPFDLADLQSAIARMLPGPRKGAQQ